MGELKLTKSDVLKEFREGVDLMPQDGMQAKASLSAVNFVVIGGNRGGGKMQPLDAKVLTPFGWSAMGDLKINSQIMNPSGRVQRVIQVHEHGEQDVYEIQFIDGAKTECGLEHLWQIRKTSCNRKQKYPKDEGYYFDGKVMTTEAIMAFLDKKDSSEDKTINVQNLIAPLSRPLSFTKVPPKPRSSCDLPAYLVGALIGDGCITKVENLAITNVDQDLYDKIEALGFPHNVCKQGKTLLFTAHQRRQMAKELSKVKLLGKYSHNKFIPEYFKWASIETRIQLMQGLMDTDGYVDDRGHMSYTSVSKRLAKDVQEVVWSLGGKATITTKVPTFTDSNGDKAKGRLAYTVWINTSNNKELVHLTRKRDRCVEGFNGGVSELGRRITGYRYIGKKVCRCITVDDPNSLYITDDFIVTHNSAVLVLKPVYYTHIPNFRAMLFRKGLSELEGSDGLGDKCEVMYKGLNAVGTDKKKKWVFPSGATVVLDHLQDEAKKKIEERIKGLGIALMGVDEIDQIKFSTLQILIESNRNAFGIPCQVVGTCNPNKNSWMRTWIDWYVGEDGFIIPSRDGAVRYFYVHGESEDDVIWGNTKDEVYEYAKNYIDATLTDKLKRAGITKYSAIKSFQFIQGDLAENRILLKNDINYYANIAQGTKEQVARNIRGNWNVAEDGEEIVKREHIDMMFDSSRGHKTDGTMRMSVDLAFGGMDLALFYIFNGHHLIDILVKKKMGGTELPEVVEGLCEEYGVHEKNVAYDEVGLGAAAKGEKGLLPRAKPVHGSSTDFKESTIYEKLKAYLIYSLAYALLDGEFTVSEHLLHKKFPYGKDKKDMKTLKEILDNERRVLLDVPTDGKKKALTKKEMIKILGFSPDYLEAFCYIMIFFSKRKKRGDKKSLNNLYLNAWN